MIDTMLHYQGSGRLVDLVPPGLLHELGCMLRCEQKVWYWLNSDYRLEEIIWVCFRALPTLALWRAFHCELVALTGVRIAGQATSLPEALVYVNDIRWVFSGL